MIPFKSAMAATAVALLTGPVLGQTAPKAQPTPEEMRKMMEATMGAMVPVMGAMTESIIEAQGVAAAKPETAARIAAFKWNLYQALLKQGFNGADAMHITVATPPPSGAPGSK